LGRQKHDKKQWSEQYHQKQIALQGKFTFPAAVELENPEKLPPGDISLLRVEQVRFSYKPETNVFIFNDPIDFNVTAATRCGVMGPNGAGKSTLLKILTEQHFPTSGKLIKHPKFTLAYFGQYSTHELDLEKTPAEWMGVQFPGQYFTTFRTPHTHTRPHTRPHAPRHRAASGRDRSVQSIRRGRAREADVVLSLFVCALSGELAGNLRQHLAKTSIVGAVQDTRMEALSFSQKSCIVFSKLTFLQYPQNTGRLHNRRCPCATDQPAVAATAAPSLPALSQLMTNFLPFLRSIAQLRRENESVEYDVQAMGDEVVKYKRAASSRRRACNMRSTCIHN
jgi:energy-coupling factor transporter ATP-binding protein EcfA2